MSEACSASRGSGRHRWPLTSRKVFARSMPVPKSQTSTLIVASRLHVLGAVGRAHDAGDGRDGVDPLEDVEEDPRQEVVARGVGMAHGIVRRRSCRSCEEVGQVEEHLVGIGLPPLAHAREVADAAVERSVRMLSASTLASGWRGMTVAWIAPRPFASARRAIASRLKIVVSREIDAGDVVRPLHQEQDVARLARGEHRVDAGEAVGGPLAGQAALMTVALTPAVDRSACRRGG